MFKEVLEKGTVNMIVDGLARHRSGERAWLLSNLRETIKLFGIHGVEKRILKKVYSDLVVRQIMLWLLDF